MTVELAQDVLKDVFPQGEAATGLDQADPGARLRALQLSLEELCGDKRSQNIVYPRQVAMYLSRELTDSSLPKIGKEFGGRDHTTVIHATSKIARLIRRTALCTTSCRSSPHGSSRSAELWTDAIRWPSLLTDRPFSTDVIHRPNPVSGSDPAVFPVVHTPYYYNEVFLKR